MMTTRGKERGAPLIYVPPGVAGENPFESTLYTFGGQSSSEKQPGQRKDVNALLGTHMAA